MVMDSGIFADATVMTYHLQVPAGVYTWTTHLAAWEAYMRSLVGFVAGSVAQTGHTLKAYDLADPLPRVPVHTSSWSFAANPTGADLPAEVALCISYQASAISGQSQASRRGRMFFGPLASGANNSGRPAAALVSALASGFELFAETSATASQVVGVWSRTKGTFAAAQNYWVDNAFDTQRRRGLDPSSRTTGAIT